MTSPPGGEAAAMASTSQADAGPQQASAVASIEEPDVTPDTAVERADATQILGPTGADEHDDSASARTTSNFSVGLSVGHHRRGALHRRNCAD